MSYEIAKATATEESFWGLLSKAGEEFAIYIPRIQRDYAQGRNDPATTQIRDRFVDDLLDSVIHFHEGKTLDVNFIYGNIEVEDGIKRFIPIDGQQRLTTLFLLHWYFAVWSGKIDTDPEVKKHLLQFQYETRNVTGKFCKNLTEYVRMDMKNIPKEQGISKLIRNYYWFFSDFENDPSIRGMLVMLDTIHEKVKAFQEAGISVEHVFELLTSEKAPIRFLFLNIDDVGLTDGIYIKMNARGKALTHFENFKAQLRAWLSDDENFANRFIDNINGKWSQFFWNPSFRRTVKDPSTGKEHLESNFDAQMMKFFRFGMLIDYIENVSEDSIRNNQKNVRDSLRELQKEQDFIFTARLFNDGFSHVYALDSTTPPLSINTFKRIEKLLNVLSKQKELTGDIVFTTEQELNKTYFDESKAFCKLIGVSDERALTNEEQVVLCAEYEFLIYYSDEDDSFNKELELSRWVRLISNLVKPTLNLQLDIFFSMIRSIHNLVNDGFALNCNEYMRRLLKRNYRQNEMFIFTEDQVVEESIKAILSNNDPSWKEIIIDSENTFLQGQTRALLTFAGITDLYNQKITEYEMNHADASRIDADTLLLPEADSSSSYFKKYKDYLIKFKMLFDKDGVREELESKALFRRALLCFGGSESYMLPPNKTIQSFLDNTDRDYSFWRLLRDNDNRCGCLKELLDAINDNKPVIEQLNTIIENKVFLEEERWKCYFVKIPEILCSTHKGIGSIRDPEGKWVFMTSQRFIRRHDNDDILLLTRTQTNSINRELYSYVLFLKAREKSLRVRYHEDYTDAAEKYAYYTNKQDEQIHVVYKRKEGEGYVFIAKKADETEVIYYNSMESMIDFIDKTIKKQMESIQ